MKPSGNSPSNPGIRPRLALIIFIALCGLLVGWLRVRALRPQSSSQVAALDSSRPRNVASTPAKQTVNDAPALSTESVVSATPAKPEATAYARQLLKAITRLDRANVPLTPEEADKWKANLEQLIKHGADGALAIAEFLQTNTDVRFGRPGLELLGVDSVREALFDALVRIGGPEAVSATLQALQTSAEPREIALLARNLETLEPEAHRHEALSAAREILTIADSGKLPGSDVAPLFEVLQTYGGSDVVPELQEAGGKWQYYSAIALASLPDGVGIPALAQMAQANGSETTMAWQLLAQLSGKHNQAQLVLLSQAQAGQIPSSAWPFLVTALGGNEYRFENSVFVDPQGSGHRGNVSTAHVRAGNQTFYNAFTPTNVTQEEIDARIAFIAQLRSVTSHAAALDALQQAEQLLLQRLPNVAASP
jgi:hypothetical protein